MSFDDYNSNEINELSTLIENGNFNNINLDNVTILSSLHECLIESNNLSNILNSLINGIKDIDIDLNNIQSLIAYVSTLKNDLQDIFEYQNNFFNEINNFFFNNY